MNLTENNAGLNQFLVEKVINGDPVAFTTLYETYAGKLCNYFSSYIKRRDIAEELTQDIFTKLWTVRSTLKKDVPFEGFLFLMARNHVYNYLKRQLKAQTIADQIQFTQVDDLDPLEMQSYKDTLKEYQKCLSELEPQQRKIFLLNREQGLTYAQIAHELGLSVKTIEFHMSKTLKILRNRLGPFYFMLLDFILKN